MQLSVKLVALLSAAVLWLPAVAFVPVQPPDAAQELAFDDDHVRVLVPPLLTVVGDADNVTTGAGVGAVTETDALACAVPPEPVQLSVKVELALNAPVVWLPEVDLEPLQLPDALQEFAFVDDQLNVLLEPLFTVAGDADNETVGAGVGALTETDALACAVPPAPLQLSVNVDPALNAPVD